MASSETQLIQFSNDDLNEEYPTDQRNPPTNYQRKLLGGLFAGLLLTVGLVMSISSGGDESTMSAAENSQSSLSMSHAMLAASLPARWTDAANPEAALCGDHSEPVYYFHEESSSADYHIFLEEHCCCYDTFSCENMREYYGDEMTNMTEESVESFGVLQVFDGFNLAYMKSCTCDLFMGQTYNEDVGLNFKGHYVLLALVDGLLEDKNMAAAETIVFSGISHAVMGLFHHMDFFMDYLAEKAPNAEVKFVLDGQWALRIEDNPWADNFTEFTKHELYKREEIPSKPRSLLQENQPETFSDGVWMAAYPAWDAALQEQCVNGQNDGYEWLCFYTASVLYDYLDNKDFFMQINAYDYYVAHGCAIENKEVENWDAIEEQFSWFIANLITESLLATDPITSFTDFSCRDHDVFQNDLTTWPSTQYDWPQGSWDYALADVIRDYVLNNHGIRQYDKCMDGASRFDGFERNGTNVEKPTGVYCNPTCESIEDWIEDP